MKWSIFLFLLFVNMLYAQDWLPPDVVLTKLMEGNDRFSQDHLHHPRQDFSRRLALTQAQWPCAVILSCSDSRVPPEIIFDQGLGDLFVVRVAGNVVGPLELDSAEFASVYLHASLIIVLGHEDCGAVKTVLDGKVDDIESIAVLIEPSVKESASQKGNRLENAIKNNVQSSINVLKKSSALQKLLKEEKLKIVGGYYELNTGKVSLVDINNK